MCMNETDVISFMPGRSLWKEQVICIERFLALKQELEEMGMFAQEYKQPDSTDLSSSLGVVTAPAGAAVQDIRNISLRRNPYLSDRSCIPALVQGEGAAGQYCARVSGSWIGPDRGCDHCGQGWRIH